MIAIVDVTALVAQLDGVGAPPSGTARALEVGAHRCGDTAKAKGEVARGREFVFHETLLITGTDGFVLTIAGTGQAVAAIADTPK